jgi:signal transduction histidine kinase
VDLNILERRIARVRLIAVPFALFQVAVTTSYPPGYAAWAWFTTGAFILGSIGFVVWARNDLVGRPAIRRSVAALAFDFVVLSSYTLAYSWEPGTPTRLLLIFPMLEGCFRFAVAGGVVMAVLTAPVALASEKIRVDRVGGSFRWDFVTFQVGFEILIALVVGWIVGQLGVEYAKAQARAAEAEELRDELRRRADLLDAVNRCARALGSSLELTAAFGAFLRELRRLMPFDRVAIVLADDGVARVMATAGAGSRRIFPRGSSEPVAGSLLEDVLAENQPIYRRTLDGSRYREEADFLELGLGSRLAAPLVAGTEPIGMVALVRVGEDAFEAEEIELLALLGRLVASAVQNIRAYEAERRTVEELRSLSMLRADFVSLVSHELRSPMAAVIGSARTLQRRWRELSTEHRDSFLALIADETDRLAMLVGDVLDTSRIEAGTFGYAFGDVDVGVLVEEAVASASAVQDAVEVVSTLPPALPTVRGDADRLRQVLANLIDNAVKYSPDGERVEVSASARNGEVRVDVCDHGGGIPSGQQRQIFEKFHRIHGPNAKPGSGLGLYIARSIVEAHGGSIAVESTPGSGSTFTVALPAG